MTKVAFVVVIFAFLAVSHAFPATSGTPFSGIGAAASNGNWDLVHKILALKKETALAAENHDWEKVHSILAQRVREMYHLQALSPQEQELAREQQLGRGKTYSESEFRYESSKNVGGEVSQEKGGVRSVNNNGQVSTFNLA